MPRLYWRRAVDGVCLQITYIFLLYLLAISITLRPCTIAGSKVETWHGTYINLIDVLNRVSWYELCSSNFSVIITLLASTTLSDREPHFY